MEFLYLTTIGLLGLSTLILAVWLADVAQRERINAKEVFELAGLVASLSRSHLHLTRLVGEIDDDCWSPDPNNHDYYDDAREWIEYQKDHPDARPCGDFDTDKYERSVINAYWTSSFDGDPDTSDPTKRGSSGIGK